MIISTKKAVSSSSKSCRVIRRWDAGSMEVKSTREYHSCCLASGYGNDYVRDTKPLKTIAHWHIDSLRKIARASLAAGEQTIAPFEAAQRQT